MGTKPAASRWKTSWRPPDAPTTTYGEHHPLADARRGTFTAVPQQLKAGASEGNSFAATFVLMAAFLYIFGTSFALSETVATNDSDAGAKFRGGTLFLAVLAGLVALRSWRRYWLVLDTPTVDVAGAHPGRCELVGAARALGTPAQSWFTGIEVVWSRATVARWRNGWIPEWERFSGDQAFRLVGDDGHAITVDPRFGDPDVARSIVAPVIENKTMISEEGLVSGDRMYVLGDVDAAADGSLRVRATRTSHRSESALRSSLRWRAALMTAASLMLAGFAALIENVPSEEFRGADELTLRTDNAALAVFGTVAAVAAVGYLIAFVWRLFNRLVELRERTAKAWSLVDVAAAQRHDLVTALVATTAAAAAHETTALRAVHVPSAPEVAAVDATLAGDTVALAVAEATPELRSSAVFTDLFARVRATEDRLAAARRFYNDAVTVLADRAGTYPGLLLRRYVVPVTPPLLRYGSDA